jgi:hypothetical protein
MSKHDKTLEARFASPVRTNIKWADAVALIEHHGGTVKTSRSGGSAHKFAMPGGAWAVIHRPHPGNELGRGRAEAFRDLLISEGIGREADDAGREVGDDAGREVGENDA